MADLRFQGADLLFGKIFAENYVKMKRYWTEREIDDPNAPLNPPMPLVCQYPLHNFFRITNGILLFKTLLHLPLPSLLVNNGESVPIKTRCVKSEATLHRIAQRCVMLCVQYMMEVYGARRLSAQRTAVV